MNYISASLLSRCLSRCVLHPSKSEMDCGGAVGRDLVVGDAVLSIFVARSPGCIRSSFGD